MTAALPIAVIGGGSIGLRHVQVACAGPATRLAVVVEPDSTRRGELAARGLPVAASMEDAPAEVRAAIIATPTPDHCASAQAALARGWPVIVEKPVAATLAETRALSDAAATAALPVIVGHHRRCHPFSRLAREGLSRLGDIVGVQGLWSLRKHDAYFDVPWRRAPGAGPLMMNLSHEIDLLHFILGGIVEVSALVSNARRGLAVEDTAALSFRFAGGAMGSFLISDAGASPWAFEAATGENPAIAQSGQDYLRIIGTRGALAFPSLDGWGQGGTGEIEWSQPLSHSPGPTLATVDPLAEQVSRFAALVAGRQDDVLCSLADGCAALEMTLATALSAREGRPIAAGAVPADYAGQ